MNRGIQSLISLPEAMAARFAELENKAAPEWYAASDPAGTKLGPVGNHDLLSAGWRATGAGMGFGEWLATGRKLIIHGGGRVVSLPAYAAVGKPLMSDVCLSLVAGPTAESNAAGSSMARVSADIKGDIAAGARDEW